VGGVRLELVREENEEPGAPVPGPGDRGSTSQRVRLADAALLCIARQGIAKTTLDDVARTAGCSRATVYRVFPGGKDGLISAVVDTEVARFFSALALRMGAALDLEDVLVAGMTEAAILITGHPGLSYLLEHEPDVVLPQLTFSHMDSILDVSSTFTAPFLGRWLDHDEAKRVAEWGARIVLCHLLNPVDGVDLTDETRVRRLIRTFMMPGDRTLTNPSTGADDTARPAPSIRAMPPIRTTQGEAS
jgi:AcrR family transcriptional regulator